MKQFCEITVLGYVTSEVEDGGGKVDMATFLRISNLDYKQKNGLKKSYKLYFKIVTTGALAQHIRGLAQVGDQVFIVGELKTNLWRGKTTNEIWVRQIRVLNKKADEDSEVPTSLNKVGTIVLQTELDSRKKDILSDSKRKHRQRIESGYYGEVSDDDGVITGDDLYGEQL